MARSRKREWTVFSHHGVVLFHIAWNPDLTVSEISQALDLSDRWVRKILDDLETADIVRVTKRGVQNHYAVNPDAPLRHPSMQHLRIGDLIRVVIPAPAPAEGLGALVLPRALRQ